MIAPDTYRDAFLRFLSDGMTHLEAYQQFCPLELSRAVNAECLSGAVQWNAEQGRLETPDGKVSLLELQSIALREADNDRDMQDAIELWLSGWTSETPYPERQKDVMSWYWRAPSKRVGKPGRRYLSTQQAITAMHRGKNRSMNE